MIDEAMIFAAGFGKRMLPLTKKIPKPLIKINEKSILSYNIEQLIEANFKKIIVNAHHHYEQIIADVQIYKPIVKVIIEKEILETGGGLLNAMNKNFFGINDSILLMNGDIFWTNNVYKSLDKIRSIWDSNEMDQLLCLKKKENFFGYEGLGDFDKVSPNQVTSKVIKNNNLQYAFTGLQIVKKEIVKNTKKRVFSIRDQILESLDKEKLFGYVDKNQWFHIGTVENLKRLKELLE